jgi:glycosyltransferase involved in cell wall biosynthesis
MNFQFQDCKPILTIITVVRNNPQGLERTILSVTNQSYDKIEYIVIDGQSSDETINVIKKFGSYINKWISESDNGIYDAMNKGINLATGDYINFMNAGDEFCNYQVCEKVFNLSIDNPDILYGDFIAKSDCFNGECYIKAKSLTALWKGLVFSHQSVFIKTQLLKNNYFDTSLRIVADYDQLLKLFKNNYSFYYLSIPISRVSIGGVSYSNLNTYYEQIRVFRKYNPFSVKLFYFVSLIILCIIRKLLGDRLTTIIRKFKWRIKSNYIESR